MTRSGERVELALETSRREASLAVGIGATVLSASLGARAHASDLLPRLEALLARAGVSRRAGSLPLAALFVGLGPGSYTGLRVGLATALGLARSSGAELFGLSSFETLAWAELHPGEEGAVVLDAHGGRFYRGRYRREALDVQALEPLSLCPAAELSARCSEERIVLLAAGTESLPPRFEPTQELRPVGAPRADALLALGRTRVASGVLRPAVSLEPLYLVDFGR